MNKKLVIKKIMNINGFCTAIIVSDPLHMKRAMLIPDNSLVDDGVLFKD